MKNLPDLSGMLLQMKVRDKLEQVSSKTILGYSIRVALMNNTPLGTIIHDILGTYAINPEGVLDIVPMDTIQLIQNLHCKN